MNVFKSYTLACLKKNKTRTLVTIIGIILSVAMFTATTEAFVTVQNYLIDFAEMYSGKYHVGFYDVEKEDVSKVTQDPRVEKYTYIQDIGYAEIGSQNEYKPYLYIGGIPENFTDVMPIHLTEGRLPENSSEIVISDHLYSNGGVKLELGQQITLNVGQRQWAELANATEEEYKELDGDSWGRLTQQTPLRKSEGEEKTEFIINTKEKTYTVVGFCVRPDQYSIEPYSAPGYTAFTINEPENKDVQSIYSILEKPGKYNEYYNDIIKSLKVDGSINHDLLMYSLQSHDSAFSIMAIGLISILMGLIVFGSVSLIYNSFSISVSERTKQFGILKSVGATKKQIKKSVLFEASVLCIIGIPIGLICGCLGIAVTFHALSDTISTFLADLTDLKMSFVLSPAALIASSVLSFVTVIISAYIPARKAIRINPIEAIKQSTEIKVKKREVKISPLTKALFGIEGVLSSKNFKRNRRKYRTTVFSLFVSVVLFISASSLATYFTGVIEAESKDMNYDVGVQIYAYEDENGELPYCATDEFRDKLYSGLKTVEGIEEFTFVEQMGTEFEVDSKYLSKEYKNMIEEQHDEYVQNQGTFLYNFIDDEAFRRILKKEGLDEKDYFDKNNPKALLYDMSTYSYQNNNKEKFYTVPLLDAASFPNTLTLTERLSYIVRDGTEYWSYGTEEIDGTLYYVYDIGYDEGEVIDPNSKIYLTEDEVITKVNVNIGAVLKEKPYFVLSQANLIYPEYVKESAMLEGLYQPRAYILAEDHAKVAKDVSNLLRELGIGTADNVTVWDYAAEIESIRALVTIAKVLAYGFIVLISLIAAANVFNTISTNISLRKKEIATLQSVGLGKRALRKMMLYESLLYGLKSLMFSLPVSAAITYLIYYVVSDSGYEMGFYIPWGNFIFAILSVFIIVFVSMVYSVRKTEKNNVVEALRSENF